MADRKGELFRRLLCSAERLSDCAIAFALPFLNTPPSRSSASLSRVTRADRRRGDFFFARFFAFFFAAIGQCRWKYCTSRSCFSAAARVLNVPRFRRLPVLGFFFLE